MRAQIEKFCSVWPGKMEIGVKRQNFSKKDRPIQQEFHVVCSRI